MKVRGRGATYGGENKIDPPRFVSTFAEQLRKHFRVVTCVCICMWPNVISLSTRNAKLKTRRKLRNAQQ